MEYKNLQEIYTKDFKTRTGDTIILSVLGRNSEKFVDITIGNKSKIQSLLLSAKQFKDLEKSTRRFMENLKRNDFPIYSQQLVKTYGPVRSVCFDSDRDCFKIEIFMGTRLVKSLKSTYENWINILDFVENEKFINRIR